MHRTRNPNNNQISELRLIEIIRKMVKLRRKDILLHIGDDGMVLEDGVVLTTDAFVEGIHFDLSYMSFCDIGRKALCAALSDLAAMVAEPLVVLVSLFIPERLSTKDIKDLYNGMEYIAELFETEIGGGDITEADFFALSLSVLGKTEKPIRRSGAKPGDNVFVTGELGQSETGRLVLKHHLSKRKYERAVQRHLSPLPRIKEALFLRKFCNSLIDTSDGLSTDTYHIAEESKVKIVLLRDRIPVSAETKEVCARLGISEDTLVLHGGEDLELLFTSSSEVVPYLKDLRITHIGTVEKGSGVYIVESNKEALLEPKGYEHLRSRNIQYFQK